tara:strand:- start:436 stop:537 length:102 start_codon:yes stop_codon:yes gene_type:complete
MDRYNNATEKTTMGFSGYLGLLIVLAFVLGDFD